MIAVTVTAVIASYCSTLMNSVPACGIAYNRSVTAVIASCCGMLMKQRVVLRWHRPLTQQQLAQLPLFDKRPVAMLKIFCGTHMK